jgi:hypothetical protein
MSGQGHMALGCSAAGTSEHAEVATAGRLASDPLGTIQSPTTAVTSSSTYNIGLQNGVYRWGDFSVTSVDPADDMTFWTVQEYCNTTDSWGVQLIKLLAPLPALPTNCSPSTVTQAVSSVSVVVKGSSSNGTGFFDPGPTFPNHLAATINGGGITINSVTYNNPTNITLGLTVAANAATGARTVTITNPDGQSATSLSGILTVVSSAATNQPPVLGAISNRTVTAGTTLVITNMASDPDGDVLTFSLGAGAATNAVINPTNGIFTWTPTQSQAGTNSFAVIVTDSGVPPLSATQSFSVIVVATNNPPVLAPIPNQTIHARMTLSITNSASDPNPGQTLTFSLDPGFPLGATVGSTTGIFVWAPSDSQIGTNSVTVRVTDNGSPPLSAAQSFKVTVVSRPLATIHVTNAVATLKWTSIAGLSYLPQLKTNFTDASWTPWPSNVLATASTASVTATVSTNKPRFYRILVVQ